MKELILSKGQAAAVLACMTLMEEMAPCTHSSHTVAWQGGEGFQSGQHCVKASSDGQCVNVYLPVLNEGERYETAAEFCMAYGIEPAEPPGSLARSLAAQGLSAAQARHCTRLSEQMVNGLVHALKEGGLGK